MCEASDPIQAVNALVVIQTLGDLANKRFSEAYPEDEYVPPELIRPVLSFLAEHERDALHKAKLSLPSPAEQAQRAKARIMVRLKMRKDNYA